MKTTLSKVKLMVLLTLIAAIICTASIAFAGIFGVPSISASADEVTATESEFDKSDVYFADASDKEEEEEEEEIAPSDNDADGSGASDNASGTIKIGDYTYTYNQSFNLNATSCAGQANIWEQAMNDTKRYAASNAYTYIKLGAHWTASPVSYSVSRWSNRNSKYQSSSMYTSFFSGASSSYWSYDGAIRLQGRVILDLNGYTISRNLYLAERPYHGFVFHVTTGMSHSKYGNNIIICDTSSSGNGKITGGNNNGWGGAIYMWKTNGTRENTLTLAGGNITGNYGEWGGGVYVGYDSNFRMTGGTISSNNAWEDKGGGVFVRNSGSFIMSGGTIKDNTINNGNYYYGKDLSAVGSADIRGGVIGAGGALPALTWQYSTNGGSSWTTATGTSYTRNYDRVAFSVRALNSAGTVVSSSTSYTNAGTYTKNCTGYSNPTYTITINKKQITTGSITGITVNSKEYDGNTTATLTLPTASSNFTVAGMVSGDSLTLSYTSATFNTSGVSVGKAVTVSGLALGGTSANNYTLSATTRTLTGDITKRSTVIYWTNTSKTYTGSAQSPTGKYRAYDGTENTLSLNNSVVSSNGKYSETNVGSYSFEYTGTNGNYTFTNTSCTWKIAPKSITLTWGTTTTFTYTGAELKPTATTTESGVTVTVKGAVNAGANLTATATITSDNAANYEISNPTKEFTINTRSVTISWRKTTGSTGYSATADVSNFTYTYNGNAQAPIPYFTGYINGSAKTIYLTATGQQTNASTGNYTATATTTDYESNYTFSGNTRTFKINAYKTSVAWTNTSLEYNNSAQKPTAKYRKVNATSDTELTVLGTGTNVDSYISSVTAPANYEFTNASVEWKITPKRISVTWGTTTMFTYNGNEQAPTATYSGLIIKVKGSVNAGTNLTATASCDNANYSITNPTKTFTINKLDVKLYWSQTNSLGPYVSNGTSVMFSYVYDGEAKTPVAHLFSITTGVYVPEREKYLNVSGYGTNVGTYTATADLSSHSANYNFDGSNKCVYKIVPFETSITWTNTALTYTGSAQGPKATYIDANGKTQTLPASSLGDTSTATNVGSYTVTLIATAVGNLQFKDTSCGWSISPKQVTVTWGSTTTFTYNGSEQHPTATCSDVAISVKGAVNAGSHTATVAIADATKAKNYVISNPTKDFTINTKSVAITWLGENGSTSDFSYTFNGSAQYPTAYFTDASGNKVNFTITGGQTDASLTAYTATATTDEFVDNYTFTGAATKQFTIYALPVSVVWENTSFEYDGKEHNPDAYYINISGAKIPLDLEPSLMGRKNVGTYTAQVKAPTNTNYQVTEDSKKTDFYIVKATPKVTPVVGSTEGLKVGMNMPTIETSGGDTLGYISWVTTTLIQGTSDYVWVFVPAKADTYDIVTGTVELEVAAADGLVITGITASSTVLREIYAIDTIDTLAGKLVILVTATYSDGSTGTVAASVYEMTAFDAKTGEVTVTLKDDANMTATFTVYVTPKAVTGIVVTYKPDGNKIYTSTAIEDIAAVEVKAVYNDGTEKILYASLYEISGTLMLGESTLVVSYKPTEDGPTFKETFTVTVSPDEVALKEISASFVQDKALIVTTELKDIDEFGTLTVEKVNNDGSREAIEAGNYELALPEGGLVIGTNIITVTFTDEDEKEYTTTFTVFVEEAVTLVGIEASFAQNSTILTSAEFKDLETFGTLTVEGVYSDGSKKEITENFELSIEDDKFIEGLNTITVTYTVEGVEEPFTTTFTVFAQVTAKKIVVIAIDNQSSIFGEEFAELTYTIISGNVTFEDGEIVLTKAEGTAIGEYAITGEYKGEDPDAYEFNFIEGVYTITPNPSAKQVTVVIGNKTSVYGETVKTDFDYTVIGLEDGETLEGVKLAKAEGTDAGKYAITGKYEGSNKYSVAFVDGVYTITPKNITVVIDNKTTREGVTLAELTYKPIGLAEGETLDGTIKLKTDAEAHTPNEYAITGTFNGKNYAITWVEGKYTVKTVATENTVFVIIDNKMSEYGEELAELSFTVETIDGTTVTKEEIEGGLTFVTDVVKGSDAGKYAVTATYEGDFTVAVIDGTYTVTPKIINVQIDNKLSFKGAELAKLSSNAPAEIADGITLSTEATGLTAGEFEITGEYDKEALNNYDIRFINGVYTVKEIAAGITHVVIVIDNQSSVVGEAIKENLTYTALGLEEGETISGIEITTTADKDKADVYTITGKYTGTGNYVVVFVEGTYTVTAKVVPEVKLSAKQTGEIFLNTTVFNGKLEFTLTVNGEESTLTADDYTLTPDLENGTVTVEFTVDGETYTETVSVFVTAKAITGISASYTQGTDKITPNTPKSDIQVKVTATYNDGTTAEIESGYAIVGTLAVGNSTPLVVTYEENGVTHSASFTVKVDPVEAGDITEVPVKWDKDLLSFVFDGKEHSPVATYEVTNEGVTYVITLKIIIEGENLSENGKAVNAGTYTAKVDETQSIMNGYKLTGPMYIDFEIEKAEIKIEWTNDGEVEYNNEAHNPKANVTANVYDGKIDRYFEIVPQAGSKLSEDGKAVYAGNYVAKLILTDSENYKVVGSLECNFSIGKSKIDPSANVKNNEFESLKDAIDYVKGLYGDKKVNVTGTPKDGEYVVSVELADKTNYVWTDNTSDKKTYTFVSSIVPVTPDNNDGGVSNVLIIALIAAMVAVAFVSLVAFIIILKKRNKVSSGDDDGFYDEFNS